MEVTLVYWGDRFARDFPLTAAPGDSVEVGGAWQLAGLVETLRRASPATFVLVAGGDLAGTPAGLKTKGKAPAKVLGRIAPDAYGPGVVDFGHGLTALKSALSKGRLRAVLSNASIEGAGPFLPADALLEREGITVAVTAVVPRGLKELAPSDGVRDLLVADPEAAVADFVRARRGSAHLVVVLSQLGWERDSLLAAAVEGLDVLVEGHSRFPFDPPRYVGRTLIVASGPEGLQIGRLTLDVDTSAARILSFRNDIMPVRSGIVAHSTPVKRLVIKQEQRFDRTRGDKLATLLTDWNLEPIGPSNLPQWAADQMLALAPSARLAVLCNSQLGRGAARGNLHERDIEEIFRFETPLIAFQITGRELRQAITRQAADTSIFLTWSGLQVVAQNGKPRQILIEGAPLDDWSEFAVITSGLLWDRFREFTGLDPNARPTFVFPVTQRQVMLDAAGQQRVISTPRDDRWSGR